MKIGAALTGGLAFDLGNSPREFTPHVVRGQTIVSTTTNGTRAINACQAAPTVLAASFLNLGATARFILEQRTEQIIMVCAGTGDHAALEDVLAAGALIERLLAEPTDFALADSAAIAWRTFQPARSGLAAVLATTDNGRRLMDIPELRADVAYCGQTDVCQLAVRLAGDGLIGVQR
jgi:2-phosphosulfolactate phosphatase